MIKLNWIEKFRELCDNDNQMTDLQVINTFLKYCTKQEKEFNKRWRLRGK